MSTLTRTTTIEELADLEKELRAHEGYLKRQWLTPEGYQKWYAKKRSLEGKLERRKQKAGIFYSEKEFLEIYNRYKDGIWGDTLKKVVEYDPKMTPNQQNRLQQLSNDQYGYL